MSSLTLPRQSSNDEPEDLSPLPFEPSTARPILLANGTLQLPTARVFKPLIGPRTYKGTKGGRGSGKTHHWAEKMLAAHLSNPTRSVCLREIQLTLADSSKRVLEDKIDTIGARNHVLVQHDRILTKGDGMIIFRGMQNANAENIKSLEGMNIGWFDEAQRASQRSIDLLYPTFRRDDAELWFSWNPFSPKDAIEKFFNENKDDPNFRCVHANYYDNPWLTHKLWRDKERDKRRDIDRFNHIWLGQYAKHSQARVFKNFVIHEFRSPETRGDWEQMGVAPFFYYGCDWGFAQDPTVLVRMFIVGRRLYIDYEAWEVGCEIDHTPALFDKVPGSRKWPIKADSANPQSISYMRRHGFDKMEPSIKGAGSIEEGIEFLKSFDIVIHPRCQNVIDEFSMYSYKIDPRTEEVTSVLEDKKNHTIDSCRYAIETLRRRAGGGGIGN